MDERFIRLARSAITNVVAPLVGLGGLVFLLVTPDATERPTLVFACLALIGVPFAGLADRKRVEEEK